jgi:hypothetical protein
MKTKLYVELEKKQLAFPQIVSETDQFGKERVHHILGMSKRFFAACMAMQAMVSNIDLDFKDIPFRKIGILSFSMADELLKQESDD